MSDMKTEVPAATAFTHWGTCPEPAMATFIMRRFPARNAVLLDIGCGIGAQSAWLAFEGFRVWGIDVAEDAIRRARARADHMNLRGSATFGFDNAATSLSFKRENLDAAVDVCTLQHLDHDQVRKALAEIYRVLKPGGWLFSMTAAPMHDDVGGHYLRREDWFGIHRLYELPGFTKITVTEQRHTYTGRNIWHWIVEAQKP